jgi:PAS domain S-box-containing protein
VSQGRVAEAIGREEEWVGERLLRFHAADGVHDHQLSDGRWVRVQDRRLPHGGRVGIRADITELVDRERSFRMLFDCNPTPMLLVDRETLRVVTANDAALQFYGYSRADFVNLDFVEIQPEQYSNELTETMGRPRETQVIASLKIHRTATGEARTVRVNSRVIEHRDRPTILVAVFDVTDELRMEEEVRRSREFLRDVLDHIPTAVFVKDMNDQGRYILCNKAAEAVYGRASADVVGATDRQILSRTGHRAISGRERRDLVAGHLSPRSGRSR